MNYKFFIKKNLFNLFFAGFLVTFFIIICIKNDILRIGYREGNLKFPSKSQFAPEEPSKKETEATFYYLIEGNKDCILKKHIYLYGKEIKEETLATLDLLSPRSSFIPKNMNGIYINDFSSIFYYDFSKRKLHPMGVYKSDIYRICDWSSDEKEFLYIKGIPQDKLGLFSLTKPRSYKEIITTKAGDERRIFNAKFIPNSRNIVIQYMYAETLEDMYGRIIKMNLDTGKIIELTRDHGILDVGNFMMHFESPKAQIGISPDGKQLAYIGNYEEHVDPKKENWHVVCAYILDLDQPHKKPRKILQGVSSCSQVSWSPNGKYIVIDRYLYETKTFKKLAEAPWRLDYPSWSPDSNYVAGCHRNWKTLRMTGWILYIPEMKKIYIQDEVHAFAWSPK